MTTLRMNRQGLLTLPGIIFSVFPTLVCPACWPAYAGLLAAFGLPFIPSTAYLFPVSLIFLAAGTVALVFKARHRRGYGPFLLGVIGSAAVLVGKFVIDAHGMTYAGAGFLIAASIWNSVPKRRMSASCGRCVSETEQSK